MPRAKPVAASLSEDVRTDEDEEPMRETAAEKKAAKRPLAKTGGGLLAKAARRATAPPLSAPSVTKVADVAALPKEGLKTAVGLTVRAKGVKAIEKQLKKEEKETPPPPERSLDEVVTALVRAAPSSSKKPEKEQVRLLMGLAYAPKGEPLLTLTALPWLHEVGGMLIDLGFDKTYAFLHEAVTQQGVRPYDLVMASPLFANEQAAFRYRIRNLTKEIKLNKGIYKCPKCGSKDTISMPKQLRGGDEPMTDVVDCLACAHRFHH